MSHILRPGQRLYIPSSADGLSRRRFLALGTLASAALLSTKVPGWASTTPSQPDADKFTNGDFIWPTLPGAYIPFARTRSLQQPPEVLAWEREKRQFIEEARNSRNPALAAIAQDMEAMSYEDFQARYFTGGEAGDPGGAPRTRGFSPFGVSLPQVGHVAIIEVDEAGEPWVVEAMPKAQTRYESLYSRFPNGVIRTRYADWILEHKAYNVWHGRMVRISDDQRAGIVEEAKAYLGRDYWFWSFDLSNDAAFYCSKLVWMAVFRSVGVALDGDTTFIRKFWVTPMELIHSTQIDMVHSAGVYGAQ